MISSMKNSEIVVGMRFGRLVTLLCLGRGRRNRIYWSCQCDCGSTAAVVDNNIRTGHTRSCGCLAQEHATKFRKTHGHAKGYKHTPEYSCWDAMKRRCLNPQHPDYRNYGARGISVCPEWASSFETFLTDVGYKPHSHLTLDRIDNNGNYTPGNVRWTTRSENLRNRRPRSQWSKKTRLLGKWVAHKIG